MPTAWRWTSMIGDGAALLWANRQSGHASRKAISRSVGIISSVNRSAVVVRVGSKPPNGSRLYSILKPNVSLSDGREVGIPHDPTDEPRSIWLLPPDSDDFAVVLKWRFRTRRHHRHFVRPPGVGKITLPLDLNDALPERRDLWEPAEESLHRCPALHRWRVGREEDPVF